MSVYKLFVGRNKGKACIIVAPDLDNAQSMVDASCKLYSIGLVNVPGGMKLEHQGLIDPEMLLLACECSPTRHREMP